MTSTHPIADHGNELLPHSSSKKSDIFSIKLRINLSDLPYHIRQQIPFSTISTWPTSVEYSTFYHEFNDPTTSYHEFKLPTSFPSSVTVSELQKEIENQLGVSLDIQHGFQAGVVDWDFSDDEGNFSATEDIIGLNGNSNSQEGDLSGSMTIGRLKELSVQRKVKYANWKKAKYSWWKDWSADDEEGELSVTLVTREERRNYILSSLRYLRRNWEYYVSGIGYLEGKEESRKELEELKGKKGRVVERVRNMLCDYARYADDLEISSGLEKLLGMKFSGDGYEKAIWDIADSLLSRRFCIIATVIKAYVENLKSCHTRIENPSPKHLYRFEITDTFQFFKETLFCRLSSSSELCKDLSVDEVQLAVNLLRNICKRDGFFRTEDFLLSYLIKNYEDASKRRIETLLLENEGKKIKIPPGGNFWKKKKNDGSHTKGVNPIITRQRGERWGDSDEDDRDEDDRIVNTQIPRSARVIARKMDKLSIVGERPASFSITSGILLWGHLPDVILGYNSSFTASKDPSQLDNSPATYIVPGYEGGTIITRAYNYAVAARKGTWRTARVWTGRKANREIWKSLNELGIKDDNRNTPGGFFFGWIVYHEDLEKEVDEYGDGVLGFINRASLLTNAEGGCSRTNQHLNKNILYINRYDWTSSCKYAIKKVTELLRDKVGLKVVNQDMADDEDEIMAEDEDEDEIMADDEDEILRHEAQLDRWDRSFIAMEKEGLVESLKEMLSSGICPPPSDDSCRETDNIEVVFESEGEGGSVTETKTGTGMYFSNPESEYEFAWLGFSGKKHKDFPENDECVAILYDSIYDMLRQDWFAVETLG